MSSADLREELSCSICLSLYTEPVSLRCGHDFCRSCIVTALDTQEEDSGVYSCPECRERFQERPQLERKRKLSNIVDCYRSTRPRLEEAEILCTFCDDPTPATKTCLHCGTSLCHKHLEKHNKTLEHDLTDPTASLTGRKCSKHKEVLKYYCQEDEVCICMSCWVAGDHKGHQVTLLDEAAEKKKEELRDTIKKLSSQRQETEGRIQNLESHRTAERGKLAEVTELFSDIRRHLDEAERTAKTEITRQEEMMSQAVADLVQELERQKDELSGRIKQIEEVCDIKNPVTILKREIPCDDIIHTRGDITSDIRDAGCVDTGKICRVLRHCTHSLIDMKIKKQLMEKSDLTLDIKTANNYLIISEDLQSASYTHTYQRRPDVPERFKSCQVLSVQSFSSGRHYWEVDVSGAQEWLIGVAAHSMERKRDGKESFIGYNEKSWSLTFRDYLFAFHNNRKETVNSKLSIKRVGIHLDYEAGRLSFYQLCHPVSLLHTFTTTFTEPLHAAFHVFKSSSIRIIK